MKSIEFFSSRKRIGRKLIYFPEINSTNRYFKEVKIIPPDGTAIFTSDQTQGSGQRNRIWQHFPGNLAFSLLLYPVKDIGITPYSILIGIALQRFLNTRFSLESEIKWPNDLLIDGKKIAGILCESFFRKHTQYLICGIGFNLFTPQDEFLPDFPVIFLNQKITVTPQPFLIFEDILTEIEVVFNQLQNKQLPNLIDEWNQNSKMSGKQVFFREGEKMIEGFVDSINKTGNLIVKEKYSGKTQILCSGEVSLLKSPS